MKLLKKLKGMVKPKSAAKLTAVKKTKPAARPKAKPAKKAQVKRPAPKKAAKPAIKKAPPKMAKPKRPAQKIVKAKKLPKTIARKPAPKAKTPTKASAKETVKKPAKRPDKVLEFAQALMQQEAEEKKATRQYPVLPGGNNSRVAMLVPLLKDLVKRQLISDWRINVEHARSANLYVERNFTVEDELVAIREDVLLTVYERFPDGTIGEAQVPIITADAAAAKQQILDAKETCKYARKKAFTLPQPSDDVTFPQSYDERMLQASFAGNGLHTAHEMFNSIKTALSPITDVKANSFEVLTSAGTARVINSNGVDVSYHKTQVYLEIVLTCKGNGEEREFIASRVAVSPEQLDIQVMLLQQAQIARDATTAKPNPGFTGDVLLGGQSVTEVFAPHHDLNPLVMHTSAKLETMGLSSLRINQPLGHFTGEPVTISSNPSLPLGLGTAPVDEEGTPLRAVELIRNGTFASYLATARYAQYLNVPVTGNLANVQIAAGATREQHLRGNNYFEIVSFSWFNPNPFSGDFSAEIRLGYHWVNGRRTAFRGGSFTGNMFKNILAARFSKEVMQSGMYYGPRAILFKQGQIVKME